jgi:hypothetical protein
MSFQTEPTMDFSQLPKMSKTPPTKNDVAPPSDVAPPAEPSDYPTPASSAGPGYESSGHSLARPDVAYVGFGMGGVWISLISGLICILVGLRFGKWLLAQASGRPFETGINWTTGEKAGTPATYFELLNGAAWTEMGLFLMGVALLLDAGLMLIAFRGNTPPRGLVALAVFVTGTAMLINIALAIYLMGLGIVPLVSLIALLVGGMVLFDHVPLLKARHR